MASTERISPFLVYGKGVWWFETADNYHFLDGATDPENHPEGPMLLHYRSSTLKDVTQRQKDCWQTILKNSVEVPSHTISIYDRDGELSHTIHKMEDATSSPTSSSTTTEIPSPSDNPPAYDTSETDLPDVNKSPEQIEITDPEAHNSPELELEAINPPPDQGHTNTLSF